MFSVCNYTYIIYVVVVVLEIEDCINRAIKLPFNIKNAWLYSYTYGEFNCIINVNAKLICMKSQWLQGLRIVFVR